MASWASMGHGMRRRSGAPSNHLESAGKSVKNRNHATHEEAYAAASASGSARIATGNATLSSVDEVSPSQLRGTLVPKKSTQAMDPTAGGKANRENIERIGAQYRITVPYTPTIDPAAGPTMANARVVPSVAGRANPNFQGGIEASSL